MEKAEPSFVGAGGITRRRKGSKGSSLVAELQKDTPGQGKQLIINHILAGSGKMHSKII